MRSARQELYPPAGYVPRKLTVSKPETPPEPRHDIPPWGGPKPGANWVKHLTSAKQLAKVCVGDAGSRVSPPPAGGYAFDRRRFDLLLLLLPV